MKSLKRYEFTKTIYIDQMMEANIGRVTAIKKKTVQLKKEIKQLRE